MDSRRHEIFLFGLPRGLEILAKRVKKHQLKGGIPHIDTLVFATIMAVLHYSYQHDVLLVYILAQDSQTNS